MLSRRFLRPVLVTRRRARQLVPIAPSNSVTVLMTGLKTQSLATIVHLGCVVKSGEMEVCQLSLVFHRIGLLQVAEEEEEEEVLMGSPVVLLVAKEEVVVGSPVVRLVAKEEVVVGAPVVLLATFAPFKTGY